ncbi:GNAT family N-acetyltransferase [Amycolatopsis sp. H20-H5]|uniref:GNAT family N-acetyltransferase n=1 Tax=Amycolatopsis sp. H20-H5 TaxID=3046309 RepID=UPI002DB95DC2|nr:GNAT family N-acetyltransferase [Amycolatopsis sp. H20-H5]MEC3979165.1 GNAT family N-acetyltransferase [Amycolatopsis sp. H20-H5]
MTERWTISPLPVDHPDAVGLLREYMTDVASRYYGRPATDAEVDTALAEDSHADLMPPTGVLLVARRDDGSLAGCVGTRLVEDGLTLLTRMYVRPDARGQRGGERLVAAAEDAARGMGARVMRLDTRKDLVEARALYARTGYVEVEPFNNGKYADHWFSKNLAQVSAPAPAFSPLNAGQGATE